MSPTILSELYTMINSCVLSFFLFFFCLLLFFDLIKMGLSCNLKQIGLAVEVKFANQPYVKRSMQMPSIIFLGIFIQVTKVLQFSSLFIFLIKRKQC